MGVLLPLMLILVFTNQSVQAQKFDMRPSSGAGIFSRTPRDTVPTPKKVLFRSLIIPGWGQITNKQIWKVPIIYAGLIGMSVWGVHMTKTYHDLRAAYYNSIADPSKNYHTDEKYGPTPAYLSGQSPQKLQYLRDYYHNHRDLVFLGVGLVYGLNVLDAYVSAQLRDFDVSKDLSIRAEPILTPVSPKPGFGLTLNLKFNSAK